MTTMHVGEIGFPDGEKLMISHGLPTGSPLILSTPWSHPDGTRGESARYACHPGKSLQSAAQRLFGHYAPEEKRDG